MPKNIKKKIKRHLRWKPFLVLLSFLFILVGGFYYVVNLSIKNIYIIGNTLLSDHDIILAANIKDYPKMFKYSKITLQKNISKLDLVDSVVVKKSLFGKLTIEIEEAKVLFYNRSNGSYVLSNGNETANGDFTGIPFLLNVVPDSIYERLIKELSNISMDSLKMVSEIEYSPSKSGDVVIDDTRFLLRMNDGNQVYINLINIDRLDMYAITYSALPQTEKGILELDSDNGNVYWHLYGE